MLNAQVYTDKPCTLEVLSETIPGENQGVPVVLERIINNFATRLQLCLNKNRGHLTDVIFRS